MDKKVRDRITLYDNDAELDGVFGGHLDKYPGRLDDSTVAHKKRRQIFGYDEKKTLKDSLYFGDLFRALMKKDCHYVTYLNSAFEGKKKSEMYIPQEVYCMVKTNERRPITSYYECVGSRFANLLGVDTVYNIAVESGNEDDYDYDNGGVVPEYDTIISVDYVPYGYKTESLDDLGIKFDEDYPLEIIFDNVDSGIKSIIRENNLTPSIDKIGELNKALAKQFLFRSLVCEDFDFCGRNVGMLLGDNGDFRLAPCFDMEFLFYGTRASAYYQAFAEKNIKFLLERMPDVLDEFMSRFSENMENGKVKELFEKTMRVSQHNSQESYSVVSKNYERLKHIVYEQKYIIENKNHSPSL